MAGTTRFRVDPLLIKVLSDTYRSTERALKELVDNAWDADAQTVRISLPAPMTGDPIVIEDDGTGMTPLEVEKEYLVVADDRRSRRGELTRGKRQVKGRKGIGKFAGLMAASVMETVTRANGQRTSVRIPTEVLRPREADLEMVQLPLEVSGCAPEEHGTIVTLSSLNQAFAYPDADKLRRLLFMDYGRSTDFAIYVNGDRLDMDDLQGVPHQHRAELPEAGPMDLRFLIGEGKQQFKGSGIVLRVQGKAVGEPSFFGLENDPEVPPRLLKQLYGEVNADGLLPGVTADWGAMIENSKGFDELKKVVAEQLKAKLAEVHKRDMALARARIKKQFEAELAKLPEHRRRIAERYVQRVLARFYNEPEEKLAVIVKLCLEALEVDDYYTVLERIEKAQRSDVVTFAEALKDFGLLDMAVMIRQAQRRMKFLDYLQGLIEDPDTTEKELHSAIAGNLWVLGTQYGLLSSNRTLSSVIAQYTNTKFTGARAAKRPDLFLAQCRPQGYLLIEFKRPSKDITRDDETQAVKYRDDLIRQFPPISIMMIGQGRAKSVDPRSSHPDLTVLSYASIISTARSDLAFLLDELSQPRLPEDPTVAAAP